MDKDNVRLLYEKTNDGLDIICDYCIEAKEVVQKTNFTKHMFAYSHENTPSAHLFRAKDYWIIKDFSSAAEKAYDPIDVFCKAQGYNRRADFNKIMQFLCQKYLGDNGVQTISEKNCAIWDDPVPAPDDTREGQWLWEGERKLNERERQIMGKFVTEKDCEDLRWYSIQRYGVVKEGKIKWCNATETYPIFLRECVVVKDGQKVGSFWKKYEPLNSNKGFRFLTFDNDKIKSPDYINNIYEYNQAYAKALAEKEESETKTELPEYLTQGVVICSGERDALACHAMGWWPIWFNSETAQLSSTMIRYIRSRNKTLPIYYIPDLDDTGQKVMRKIANQFPDIWVVELPPELKLKKDNRGKPMKDLRDWVESTPDMSRFKFDKLMHTAVRVQYWDIRESKSGEKRVSIDTDCLHFFLRTNGIEPVKDENIEGSIEIGHHVNDFIIESFEVKDVVDYVLAWAQANLLPREVKNALLDGVKLDESKLMRMLSSSYSFIHHDLNSQTIYFRDRYVVIDDKGIQLMEPKAAAESRSKIWKKSVIDRPFRFITHDEERPMMTAWGKPVLDKDKKPRTMMTSVRTKLFHYEKKEGGFFGYKISINPEAYKSPAFKVLCATSHIFWNVEQRILEEQGHSPEEIREYWQKNWYNLDSPWLAAEQIEEQKASLISKLFIIGYYGWDRNSPSAPWAAYIMDDFDGEGSNGGSGKSLIFSYINNYKSVEVLDGRRKENNKDKHIFASVNSRTRVILFDDFWGDFSDWYQPITSGVRVERKGENAFTIPLEMSPKLAFTTNGVGDTQQSSLRRQIRSTCSNFFHDGGGQFDSAVTPSDFVGPLWGSNYSDENWRYDDNVFLECIEEAMPFLKASVKIEPPMQRVELRKLRSKIGKANIEFFDDYFRPGDLSHADQFISREEFVDDYRKAIRGKSDYITETDLLERLAKWAAYRSWVLAYCPKGVAGWCGDLKGEYRKSRIVQNSKEGIYIATSSNDDPNLAYLKDKASEAQRKEDEEAHAAALKAADPALRNVPF